MDWVGGESSWERLGGLSMSNKELSYGTVGQEQKEQKLQKKFWKTQNRTEIREVVHAQWDDMAQLLLAAFSLGKPS